MRKPSRKTINFIGCGRVGMTLAKLLSPIATIQGIVTTALDNSTAAVRFIGQGFPCETLKALPPADITFITTPDNLIGPICREWEQSAQIQKNSIVVHCSGALSSECLRPFGRAKYYPASFHPIKSFAHPLKAYETFAGTYCSLEGEIKARRVLATLFRSIGARVFTLKSEQKILYHVACVMANNYSTVLYAKAEECFKKSGLSSEKAHAITAQLMLDAINNSNELKNTKALTGPIQRGDEVTIAKHLAALKEDPLIYQLYSSLGLAALSLTSHPDNLAETLKKILSPLTGTQVR